MQTPEATSIKGENPPATERGFILQPTYRVRAGHPVVVMFGVLESGASFALRDDRQTPHFWIEAEDAEAARALSAPTPQPSEHKTMTGKAVNRIDVRTPRDAPLLRDRLHESGISTYEADVRFAMRYLIDRGIRGSINITGRWTPGERTSQVFRDPEVSPGDFVPRLRVLSIDIETDPKIRNVLSIGLYGSGAHEVLLVDRPGSPSPADATVATGEADLLTTFAERVRTYDPDVIVGWNVADFDFDVLLRRAAELGVRLDLGRAPGNTTLRRGDGWRQATQVSIPGRVVLDGPLSLRSSFISMERMSLDFVAREVLGEGKSHSGDDRAEAILDWFENDRQRLVEYNLRDARLALEIFEQLELVELAVERSRITGMPIDRVSASVASFDSLYLSELHRRKTVAPSVGDPAGPNREHFTPMTGGHLLVPVPGLHENVLVLDFKSLYPSLMRTFQIDPLGYARGRTATDALEAPNGARFERRPGILTDILNDLFPRREQAKKTGNESASQAIKILMNSFYGIFGTPACRFFEPGIANAITGFGKEILLYTRDLFEKRGYPVLYGDTDSLFVLSGEDRLAALALAPRLAAELNREIAAHLRRTYRVESRLELEFEHLFVRLFLPTTRGGSEGALKRYAGLIATDDGDRVSFTGLEAVRRDWTDFARRAQRLLYERLFRDQPIEEELQQLVERLRAGELNDLLVYRKAMRKDESEYTRTTPPHVAAARKMKAPPGRLIEYVMTRGGPEPAEERTNAFDYAHYVTKQLRPIAEPVLEVLGLDFEKVIGDDVQLDLF